MTEQNSINYKHIDSALVDVLKAGVYHRYQKDSKLIQEYKNYVKELRKSSDKEAHIRKIGYMIFPDENSYNRRMARYKKWYGNKKRLLESLEKLYELYYNLSKEGIPTENQIEDEVEDIINDLE